MSTFSLMGHRAHVMAVRRARLAAMTAANLERRAVSLADIAAWNESRDMAAEHRQTARHEYGVFLAERAETFDPASVERYGVGIDRRAVDAELTAVDADDFANWQATMVTSRDDGRDIPSGRIARTAEWTFIRSGTERLTDLFAQDYMAEKLHLLPADTAMFAGDIAARLCRSLARTAVARGRIATASWEAHAADISDACLRPVSWVAGSWQARRYAENVEAVRPTPLQIIVASLDPQARHFWAQRLEHHGSAILRASNLPTTRPDVLPQFKTRLVSLPDRVAYRGEPRFELPQPCRYGQNGLQNGLELAYRPWQASNEHWQVNSTIWHVNGAGETVWTFTNPVCELLTSDPAPSATFRRAVTLCEYDPDTQSVLGPLSRGRLTSRRVEWCTYATPKTSGRSGWRGHRKVSWELATKKVVAGTHTARAKKAETSRPADSTSTRGKAVGPWSMSPRSLPRAVAERRPDVDAIVAMLTAAANDIPFTFSNGTTVTVMAGSQVFDPARGRAYGLQEWSRRAVLAGIA